MQRINVQSESNIPKSFRFKKYLILRFSLSLLLILSSLSFIWAQEDCTVSPVIQGGHAVFDDSIVPRIDISIAPVDLQSIMAFPDSNTEYMATFKYNDRSEVTILENVGFRLRGNTSRNAAKKSFKVSFNAFEAGRKFQGLEKMNLNGEHNDPSIIRSKLCWGILGEMDVIGARANHVELYVNDEYRGLYLNVEHIDEEFVSDRYGKNNDGGNLYKCLWPADLNYKGNDPEEYKEVKHGRRTYDLKTNKEEDDYSDLAHFITVLNETPEPDFKVAISEVLDVDVFLRTLAADVFMGNWDGYSFNINNFYLYHNPATDKFEYIAYDLDNTLGIDWFNIDWGTRNIYNWTSDSHNNVLTDRILSVPEYRNRYTYYLHKLTTGYVNPNHIFPIIDCLHDKIRYFAEGDTYRTLDYGFSIEDFHTSYEEALGGHVDYGVKEYFTTRRNNIFSQLDIQNIAPIIRRVQHSPQAPRKDDPITFWATVEDDSNQSPSVFLNYKIDGGEWNTVMMEDNGNQGDEVANNGIYTYRLQTTNLSANISLQYYITANDNANLQNREPLVENYRVEMKGVRPALSINEFMASNQETIADEFGEYDDWIELYNGGDIPIFLGDKFLTDNLGNPDKWQLPEITLAPKDFLLVWADNQEEQGTFHASFKLNKDMEEIGIFDSEQSGFAVIDTLSYENLESDVSYGLILDGEGSFTNLKSPTPNASNIIVGIAQQPNYQKLVEDIVVFPNPFEEIFNIEAYLKQNAKISVTLWNASGQKNEVFSSQYFTSGTVLLQCKTPSYLQKGVYLLILQIETGDNETMQIPLQKLLKME